MKDDSASIRERVIEIIDNIEKSNKELKKMRTLCSHEKTKIELDVNEDGSSGGSLRVFCEDCFEKLGYPNRIQIKEYDEKNNIK